MYLMIFTTVVVTISVGSLQLNQDLEAGASAVKVAARRTRTDRAGGSARLEVGIKSAH